MRAPAPVPLPKDVDPADPRVMRLLDLVRQYAGLVRHVVRSVGGPRLGNDAEDIEQTVYLHLWQQVRREQVIDHPASYVYGAAVRETVRAVRRLREPAPLPSDPPSEATSAAPGPEQAAIGAETRAAFEQALDGMPADRARAVRAHLQGLTVQEIMTLHGWRYQKARNLVSRGMADLRTTLRQRGVV
jgi:RNA polymerase sigma factor (sigma-70 family)